MCNVTFMRLFMYNLNISKFQVYSYYNNTIICGHASLFESKFMDADLNEDSVFW